MVKTPLCFYRSPGKDGLGKRVRCDCTRSADGPRDISDPTYWVCYTYQEKVGGNSLPKKAF